MANISCIIHIDNGSTTLQLKEIESNLLAHQFMNGFSNLPLEKWYQTWCIDILNYCTEYIPG
jgi:hypothetical protein